MINFIRDSPEFRPLTFSVILPEFQSSLVDFLLEYIGQRSIEAYKVRARDLSLKTTWINRVRLTWVFVIHDLSSLNIFIYWQREIWKSGSQYLIVFSNEQVVLPWRTIFGNLWKKYRVYRIVFISVQDDYGCLMKYMPFEGFANGFGSVHRLCLQRNSENSVENDLQEEVLHGGTKLFEDFRNLNDYPMNVIVFESLLMNVSYDKGRLRLAKPDANVVFTLEKAMGAKFHIKATRKIEFKGDPFASSLQSVETGDVEMVVTGFFVKVYAKFRQFQFTCAVYEDKLCFLSPDSGLVPKAYMPFLPFQKDLWALLMLYNVLITLLWFLVKYINETLLKPTNSLEKKTLHTPVNLKSNTPIVRFSRNEAAYQFNHSRRCSTNTESHFPRDPRTLNLQSCSSRDPRALDQQSRISRDSRMLNLPNRAPPEIPGYATKLFTFVEHLCYPLQGGETSTQRALLFGTLFFGLIVNGLYQSYLVSSLSKPFHYPQMHTLEDVLDSGKIVVTRYANLKNVFLDDSAQDMRLYERINVMNSRGSTKDFVAYGKKISITRYYTMMLQEFSYYDKEGNPLVYLVDECPMNYRVSYVLRFHSPYAERVDFVLLRLGEAGLLGSWMESMVYPIRIGRIRRKLESEKRRIRLTLEHYSLTFLLLFLGLLGSATIFFWEVYAAKRNARRR
ncbi:PREDICTED: uncharacterized protein LOC108572853 [Habropoda laboriosa]|uniref:uncharacterized protein LOC108572853 n=1 Tax=Habropoda laboriosa TaxID=597456 RepID=UPI00083E27F0|nr:PREDICTED: uncharacterized protein LOC108572853 [Habropoda laboriosa]